MSTISSSWTEDVALSFDDTTPAKETEGKAIIDLAAAGYISAMVQLEITFGDSADGNAEIRLRNSSDSGTKKDTIPFFTQAVPFTVSTTERMSVEIREQPYTEVGVYNGNAAAQDITIAGKYAGLKYTNA